MIARLLLVLPLMAAAASAAPAFDRVVLTDGRIIEGDIVDSDDPSRVLLRIHGVDVPIRADLVKQAFRENLDDYVPQNKKEEEYLAKGWVLFEGNWMSASRRDQELAKRAQADKAAIDRILDLQKWKNAIEKSSAHFTVKSNCDEAVIDDYLSRLEDFWKYYRAEWGSKLSPGERKGKLGLDLYRSFADVMRIGSAGGEITISFNFGTGDMTLFHDASDPDAAYRNLYEAAFAQLSYYSNPKFLYPTWFSSAMADYMATIRVDASGNHVTGELQYGFLFRLRDELAAGKLPPLIEAILPEKHEYKPIHTPMRWAFVYFLMESPQYGKATKVFYTSLSNNKDANVRQGVSWYRKGAAVEYVEQPDLIVALEKRLGRSIGQLEQEWLAWMQGLDTEYPAQAYADAGGRSLSETGRAESDEEGNELVEAAFRYYARAAELGMNSSWFYRRYAELLRKGGISEQRTIFLPRKPDPEAAWAAIQRAIELDPVDPYNYTEAAGILLLDGQTQDIDKAADLAETAKAIAGPRDSSLKSLYEELMATIEPARERARERAENAAALAASDQRNWHVAFYYVAGETPPENLEDLSTADLRDLIAAGKVTGRDFVFQTWQEPDPETGEPLQGSEKWDLEWVSVADCPVFAEALAQAAGDGDGVGDQDGG